MDCDAQNSKTHGKILLLVFENTEERTIWEYITVELGNHSYEVNALFAPSVDELPQLTTYDQMWVVAGHEGSVTEDILRHIQLFTQRGRGLYVMADNAPFVRDANTIAARLHNVTFSGDYEGGKLVKPEPVEEVPYVYLFTGLEMLFEGNTVSTLNLDNSSCPMHVLWKASNGAPLVAAATDNKVLYDGAFTRLYSTTGKKITGMHETAKQWYANVADFLQPKQRGGANYRETLVGQTYDIALEDKPQPIYKTEGVKLSYGGQIAAVTIQFNTGPCTTSLWTSFNANFHFTWCNHSFKRK